MSGPHMKQFERRIDNPMDDDAGAQKLHVLWIDWTNHIVSFHEEMGYKRLEFATRKDKMEYVFQKGASGFRIQ